MSGRTVRCSDWGLFPFLLPRMTGFENKEYYVAWRGGFPTSDRRIIGEGIPGIKRLDSLLRDKGKVDLFFYPDFYMGDEQEDFRDQGFPVFGCGDAEILERDRELFRDTLKKIGLPWIPATLCKGTDDLRDYLESLPKDARLVIKSSDFRGDFETTPIDGKNMTVQAFIDRLPPITFKLGAVADRTKFICEKWVESDCEPGYSGFNTDGIFSDWGMVGYEKKGDALVGRMYRDGGLPPSIKNTNDKLAPELKRLGCRGFFVIESRFNSKGVCLPLDICMRAGSPDVEGLCEVVDNFSEVVEAVANGKQAKIKPAAKFVGILKFHSRSLVEDADIQVKFPKEIARWVKIRNWFMKGGNHYSISQDKGDNVGSVVAIGNSVDEVEKLCLERMEQVHCVHKEVNENAFDDIRKYMKAGEKYGIRF